VPRLLPATGGAVVAQPVGEPACRDAAGQEAGECEQRAGDGETDGAAGGETEEDHVAGHVGDEHVPELQVGDSVDDPGHDREQDQQRREHSLLAAAARNQGFRDLLPDYRDG
jgi:hypothetical protein